MATIILTMTIESTAFKNNGDIPKKYSCDGDNINPPLDIKHWPPETKSIAIVLEDPDATAGTFDHWVICGIKPTDHIQENFQGGVKGLNGRKKTGYTGPCPPSGRHRYFFKAYALDTELPNLQEGFDKRTFLDMIKGHVLAGGEIMGYYSR